MATGREGKTGFRFRGLRPGLFVGTASDRYAGWLGQVYTPARYEGRIVERPHEVGGRAYTERVLPVDSVEEYFEHFGVLEIDATFYRPLVDERLHPTPAFHLLRSYASHLREGDLVLLKAPQAVIAPRVRRGGAFAENPDYLDADWFTHRFYAPAARLLGPHLAGIVFEQEYVRKAARDSPAQEAADLERFFRRVPPDRRYHVELRTEAYLKEGGPVLGVLARLGVGLVLSHWTWLPHLADQFAHAGGRVLNEGGDLVIRLLTPHGVRYEESYARAYPFDRLVEGMLSERMLEEAAAIVRTVLAEGDRRVFVIVNNRAGGNAPLIAERFARLAAVP